MEKKELKNLLIIFFLALVLRIGFILSLDNSVDVWGDWWDELGWKIATGQGYWVNNPYFSDGKPFYSWRTPGFPFFLAIVYFLFGHSYLAAKFSLAILGSFSCIFVHLIALKIFTNKRISVFSGLLYAFYPPAIFWTGYLAPVTVEILLSLILFYLFFNGVNEKNNRSFLISGIVLGYGILTRSLFMIFLPSVFIWLIFVQNATSAFKTTFMIFLISMLAISPWTIRNFMVHKRLLLTSTEGGIVCYIANNEKSIYQPSGYYDPTGNINEPIIKQVKGLSEVEANSFFYKSAFNFIRENSYLYLSLVKDRFKRFWRPAPHTFSGPGENYSPTHVLIALAINLPIFLFAVLGLFFSLPKIKDYLLLYLIIVMWSAPVILLFKTVIRYREPVMPFVIIIAVTGLQGLYFLFRRK